MDPRGQRVRALSPPTPYPKASGGFPNNTTSTPSVRAGCATWCARADRRSGRRAGRSGEPLHILRHGRARVLYPHGTHEAEATREVEYQQTETSRSNRRQPSNRTGVTAAAAAKAGSSATPVARVQYPVYVKKMSTSATSDGIGERPGRGQAARGGRARAGALRGNRGLCNPWLTSSRVHVSTSPRSGTSILTFRRYQALGNWKKCSLTLDATTDLTTTPTIRPRSVYSRLRLAFFVFLCRLRLTKSLRNPKNPKKGEIRNPSWLCTYVHM